MKLVILSKSISINSSRIEYLKHYKYCLSKVLLILFLLASNLSHAATITSTSTGGTWSTGSTWVGGVVPTTNDTAIIASGATVTLSAAITVTNLTINSGGILKINAVRSLTISNNFVNNGQFIATTGRIVLNNVSSSINNLGVITMGAGRITLSGNFINSGSLALSGTEFRLSGNGTQSIAGFTSTGLFSNRKSGGVATVMGNLNVGRLTCNGNGSTLNLGTTLNHTFSGIITLTAGTLNGGSSILNINAVSTTAWNGNGSVFVAGTSTVKFSALGNQRLSNFSTTTFNNLTFSNSGIKTLTTTRCTVNGIVSMEGTATVSAAPTYGANATLKYNTPTSRTAGVEWVTPFTGLGGVLVSNTGTITMNGAKTFNAYVPLRVDSGATLATSSLQLTFGGDFTNSGSFLAGSSPIVINNAMVSQSISGFLTTGLLTMSKTAGTATLLGNISANGISINGNGGTLNLGTSLNHSISGIVTLTAGSLNGGSSVLNVNSISTSAWNGNGSLFVANSGTVNFGGAGNQTLSASTTTFNNLTFSNSGIKTITTTTCIVNGILNMEGSAAVSSVPTYGANATLRYNTSASRNAGVEWISPFAGLGGVVISNTGIITMNNAKTLNTSVPMTIDNGATLITANLQLTLGGNFNSLGTFIAGSSPIVINGTMLSQNISGFSTTGNVSMNKTAGTATFTGNTNGSNLTINGVGGTLNLGVNLIHSYSVNINSTAGTINCGSAKLKIGGAWSGIGATFISGSSTVEYNGNTQNIAVLPYYNLVLSGTSTKTFTGNINAINTLSINAGVVANLGNGLVHTFSGLLFNNVYQISGSWGGFGSTATNINTTYFAASTGKINNNCSIPVIVTQPTIPTPICSGSGTRSISVVATGSGITYSWRKDGVIINNGGIYSGQGTSTLTLVNPTTSEAGAFSVLITGTCGTSILSSSVNLVVNELPIIISQPSQLTVCQNTSGIFSVTTSATSPTYQWQYSANPIATWINTNSILGMSGNNSNVLNYTNANVAFNNYYFRCVITSNSGCISYTNPALLFVTPNPTVGQISQNQNVCINSSPQSDISLTSALGNVQWQKSSNASFTLNVVNLGINSTILPAEDIGQLNSTTYFRAIVSNGNCNSVISATTAVIINSTSWTSANGGSWTAGVPTSSMAANILYNYTSNGDLYACKLTIDNNAVVTILSGDSISLDGEVNVISGSLTLNNNASLIQSQDIANTGNIIVKRETSPLMRLDYVLWSAPVANQQLQSFSPGTLSNRFYNYNSSTNLYDVISSPSTTNFNEGIGYLIRVPNGHPTSPTVLSRTFSGVPNNGNFDIPVINNTYNAIGNPYPSPIDATTFITDNNIDEAIYFWRKTNNAATSSYATYTLAGGVSNSIGDPLSLTPNGIIQVGQGFIVKSTSDNLMFTNSMRISDTSNQFFRLAQVESENRVWINLTNETGFFGQTMIAYMEDATISVDPKMDGKYYNDCQTALTSLINNEEYIIQARGLPFETSDVVPLGFKSELPGNYSISINNVDGLFADGQEVFLKDNLTNTIHNLSNESYSFASEGGIFNTRFEIIYQSTLASQTQVIDANNVVVYKQGHDIVINTGKVKMNKVKVFDSSGRLLLEERNINASTSKVTTKATNQLVIIQITTIDDVVINKKVIN